MERRLAALQESMLALREPDLSPVLSSMRKLDARLDMGSVDSRLASIEYTLAALNHILRARDFGHLRGEGEYVYRQPVATPPKPEPQAFATIDQVFPKAPVPQRPAEPTPEPEPKPEPAAAPESTRSSAGNRPAARRQGQFADRTSLRQ